MAFLQVSPLALLRQQLADADIALQEAEDDLTYTPQTPEQVILQHGRVSAKLDRVLALHQRALQDIVKQQGSWRALQQRLEHPLPADAAAAALVGPTGIPTGTSSRALKPKEVTSGHFAAGSGGLPAGPPTDPRSQALELERAPAEHLTVAALPAPGRLLPPHPTLPEPAKQQAPAGTPPKDTSPLSSQISVRTGSGHSTTLSSRESASMGSESESTTSSESESESESTTSSESEPESGSATGSGSETESESESESTTPSAPESDPESATASESSSESGPGPGADSSTKHSVDSHPEQASSTVESPAAASQTGLPGVGTPKSILVRPPDSIHAHAVPSQPRDPSTAHPRVTPDARTSTTLNPYLVSCLSAVVALERQYAATPQQGQEPVLSPEQVERERLEATYRPPRPPAWDPAQISRIAAPEGARGRSSSGGVDDGSIAYTSLGRRGRVIDPDRGRSRTLNQLRQEQKQHLQHRQHQPQQNQEGQSLPSSQAVGKDPLTVGQAHKLLLRYELLRPESQRAYLRARAGFDLLAQGQALDQFNPGEDYGALLDPWPSLGRRAVQLPSPPFPPVTQLVLLRILCGERVWRAQAAGLRSACPSSDKSGESPSAQAVPPDCRAARQDPLWPAVAAVLDTVQRPSAYCAFAEQFPRSFKASRYLGFVETLLRYLVGFARRRFPILNLDPLLLDTDLCFEFLWCYGRLPGWIPAQADPWDRAVVAAAAAGELGTPAPPPQPPEPPPHTAPGAHAGPRTDPALPVKPSGFVASEATAAPLAEVQRASSQRWLGFVRERVGALLRSADTLAVQQRYGLWRRIARAETLIQALLDHALAECAEYTLQTLQRIRGLTPAELSRERAERLTAAERRFAPAGLASHPAHRLLAGATRFSPTDPAANVDKLAVGLEPESAEDVVQRNALGDPLVYGEDGEPLPLWIFKLQGLDQYYLCEICGGVYYRGPLAFERHFSGWRHAVGLRALGIPGSYHFKDIASIKGAQALWAKLRAQGVLAAHSAAAAQDTARTTVAAATRWDPDADAEVEGPDGQVYTRSAYQALVRQGLMDPPAQN